MGKFLMAVPPIVEGKLLPLDPKPQKPSRKKRAAKWLALQADLLADEIRMAIYQGKRQAEAELSQALTLARFIAPAVKVAAVVIAADSLSYLMQGVTG